MLLDGSRIKSGSEFQATGASNRERPTAVSVEPKMRYGKSVQSAGVGEGGVELARMVCSQLVLVKEAWSWLGCCAVSWCW